MSGTHLIVWDLDMTLGRFDALNGKGDSTEPVGVQLRPHLSETLAGLGRDGFRHCLLTLATPLYAELVLRGLGLRDRFERVEGHGRRGKGDVAGIAADSGIDDEDKAHRMIFIGDHPLMDEPRDARVVFHLEPFALQRSAREASALLTTMRDLGGGSLSRGFEEIGRRAPWWKRMWDDAMPLDRPQRRSLAGLPALLLMRRAKDCPVIAFAEPPQPPLSPDEAAFVPADWRKAAGGDDAPDRSRLTP